MPKKTVPKIEIHPELGDNPEIRFVTVRTTPAVVMQLRQILEAGGMDYTASEIQGSIWTGKRQSIEIIEPDFIKVLKTNPLLYTQFLKDVGFSESGSIDKRGLKALMEGKVPQTAMSEVDLVSVEEHRR